MDATTDKIQIDVQIKNANERKKKPIARTFLSLCLFFGNFKLKLYERKMANE